MVMSEIQEGDQGVRISCPFPLIPFLIKAYALLLQKVYYNHIDRLATTYSYCTLREE